MSVKLKKQRQDERTSHVDRDMVARRLAAAASEGHITPDELERRLARTHEAHSYDDLAKLVRGLPDSEEPVLHTIPEHTVPETLHVSAPFRDAELDGEWSVPRRVVASAGRGMVRIDFTQSVVSHREVTVDARPNLNNVEITVPEGYAVTTEDATPGASGVQDLTTAEPRPDAPRVHVVAQAGLGSIVVRHPRAGRSLRRPWLRRRRSSPRS